MSDELRFGKGSVIDIKSFVDGSVDNPWRKFSELKPNDQDGFLHGVTNMITEGCGVEMKEVIGEEKWKKYIDHLVTKYFQNPKSSNSKTGEELTGKVFRSVLLKEPVYYIFI
jgi:hypothetical protein